jgi:hypothetical protein
MAQNACVRFWGEKQMKNGIFMLAVETAIGFRAIIGAQKSLHASKHDSFDTFFSRRFIA